MQPTDEPPCEQARVGVGGLKVPMSAEPGNDEANGCLFPADEIVKLFQKDFVERILKCDCKKCKTDRDYFGGGHHHPDHWIQYADRVVKHATSLFALLAQLFHPMLIIGILHKTGDEQLRHWSTFTKDWLETKCWPELFKANRKSAKLLLDEFEGLKHHFLMEKIDGTSREYDRKVILPFTHKEKVGKGSENGEQAQGNFGILYKFEIPEYYREFKPPEIFKTPYYVSRNSDH